MPKAAYPWQPFKRVRDAQALAHELNQIPESIALTPLRDKRPYRENWNHEPPVSREAIAHGILKGNQYISKKTGKPYLLFDSGYGIRTGEISGGILCIDIDGDRADELLTHIGAGRELPKTWEWTSGKPGRRQLAFQIPDRYREELRNFQRRAIRQWNGMAIDQDLDFRYNFHQSALPPSRHPDTGAYRFINSMVALPLAEFPDWFCEEVLIKLVHSEILATESKARSQRELEQRKSQREHIYLDGIVGKTNLSDILALDILPRLATEEIFNWNGHSFKQQRNKLVGFCPQHGGQSGTAFQVNPKDNSWYCHGCGVGGYAVQYRYFVNGGQGTPHGKDYVEIVRELADDAGVELPSPPSQMGNGTTLTESDLKWLAEYETWLKEQEEIDCYELEKKYHLSLHNIFTRLGRKLRHFRNHGSEPQSASIPQVQPTSQVFTYSGGNLPTPEEYVELGEPPIAFAASLRRQLYIEVVQKGWQHILDSSQPGGGKSHDAGLLKPEDFEASRIWFISNDHRNPTVITLEQNFVDMPVRHNGLVSDSRYQTPMGRPYLRHPKKNETPTIPGNCHRADYFHLLAAKGYEGVAKTESADNPVCHTCPLTGQCPKSSGNGYGYRAQRHAIFGDSQQVIPPQKTVGISPKSLPGSDRYPYQSDINIWDEAASIISATKNYSGTLSDFDTLMAEIEMRLPEVHQALRQFRFIVRPYLSGDEALPRYGLNDRAIREKLPPVPENISSIITALQSILPSFEELLVEPNSVRVEENRDELSQMSQAERRRTLEQFAWIRRTMRRDAARETLERIYNLASNWLIPFLMVWADILPGYIKIHSSTNPDTVGVVPTITTTIRDGYHHNIAANAKANFYLDATCSKIQLGRLIGIERSLILEIAEDVPTYQNLTIIQVDGFGKAGKQRSQSLEERLAAFKNFLRAEYGNDVAISDHMRYAIRDGDEIWHHGNEARGSNQYVDKKVLALVGEPYRNIGEEEAIYQTITGRRISNDPNGFKAYLDEQLWSAYIQEAGRLRSHRRPTEQLTLYIVTSSNTDFLQRAFPGAKFDRVDIFTLCQEAATKTQKTRAGILEAAKIMVEQGLKLTQSGLAAVASISQGRISQIAQEFGGWKLFRKLLATLLENSYRVSNNLPKLDKDQTFLAETYLPLALDDDPDGAIGAVQMALKEYGSKVFESILATMRPQDRVKLLVAIVSLLPADIQERFLAIASTQ